MKFITAPLLALALASTLTACTPPDDAQNTTAQPVPAPEMPATEKPPEAATVVIPTLRSLDETQRAESVVPATSCNLESADGLPFAGADLTLTTPVAVKVTGWLRADRAGAVVEKPTLRVETEDKAQLWDIPVLTTIARDDLSPAVTGAAMPGFEADFDASVLAAGRYHLYLAYKVDGILTGCDNGRYIKIL